MIYYTNLIGSDLDPNVLNPFVAPVNFDPTTQSVNIYDKYLNYNNVNKQGIYLFSNTTNTLDLTYIPGISYHYGLTRDGIDYTYDATSLSNPFIVSDINRWIIVNSTTPLNLIVPNGAIWLIVKGDILSFSAYGSRELMYIHYIGTATFDNIPENAFWLTSLSGLLTIPNSVKEIYTSAFTNCYGLTGNLYFPPSVRFIGTTAFNGCTGLSGNLTIPSSINYIGHLAIGDCTQLTGTLTINCILTDIVTYNNNPFGACYFSNIISNSSSFIVYDSVLYQLSGSNYIALSNFKGVTSPLTFHTNTTIIASRSFWETNRTGTLNLPSTLTAIGDFAFYSAIGFTGNLLIPSGNELLTERAIFCRCSGLNGYVSIPASISVMADNIFLDCSNIISYKIYRATAPTVTVTGSPTFGNYTVPLHILTTGSSGYTIAPWTDTAIFSSIIKDL